MANKYNGNKYNIHLFQTAMSMLVLIMLKKYNPTNHDKNCLVIKQMVGGIYIVRVWTLYTGWT